ncbi:MAG: hypothetical protein M5U12_07355 [Verrucomicrobia bacterium]|nr:hypothetical protein [Verrucomicrobiota bacterium]
MLAATSDGLWAGHDSGRWERVLVADEYGRDWAAGAVLGVALDEAGVWWVALPSGVACRRGAAWTFYTGREGLPYADFTGGGDRAGR